METNKQKTIWITTDWEVNPFAGENVQLGRMNSLAMYLSQKGYKVVLWFTTFSHPLKTHIQDVTEVKQLNENLKIVLIHSSIDYKTNMSPMRVLYHGSIAKKMGKLMEDEKQFGVPDLIFCSYPPEQFCRVAQRYARKRNIPTILDARDQWPDIFERAFPESVRTLSKICLKPFKIQTKKVFSNASAICAMSPVMLEWAFRYAGREKTEKDHAIFISSPSSDMDSEKLEKELVQWEKEGITKDTWNICFFSTLSKTAVDLDTVIKAVKILHDNYPQIRLVIGGKGDDEARLRESVKDITYIKFAGWLNKNQMNSLMSISKIGLLCYRNTSDFKDGWGNKVGQYLSYGLPLLTPVTGFARSYINEYNCGLCYEEDNTSSLCERLEYLINNPEEHKNLVTDAQKCFEIDFDETVVCNKFESMIWSVLDNNQLKNHIPQVEIL